MTGRIAYFMVAGAAVIGGMAIQGDITRGGYQDGINLSQALISGNERDIDRAVDRLVDRETREAVVPRGKVPARPADPAAPRGLAAAVAELVRAEGSLVAAKLDDETPGKAIEEAEERRDSARQTVESLSRDIKAERRQNRHALRDDIRASMRDAVRH